jgi:glycosyltransferase involved in cell wall biosynthesis
VRILLLTQVVPYPPDSGPKIKTLSVLKYLATQHEVHLVSFARSRDEEHAARGLSEHCASMTLVPLRRSRMRDLWYLRHSLRSGRPFLVERDDTPQMRRAVQEIVRRYRFDAVHADQLTMGQFAVDLQAPLRVLDEHNAVWTIVRRAASRDSLWPRRVVAKREWRLLRAYEGELCRRFDAVTVVSEEDRYWLEAAAGATFRSVLVPIAVDTDALPYKPRRTEARSILSVATMFYPPNAEGVGWFAREVYPLIRRRMPEVTFTIAGSRPPSSIRRLGTPGSGIMVTGYVQDLDPLVDACGVLVVPIHAGSGMRVKILEAFARGIPVVSTTIGAEGIDARHGEHLLIADTPSDFADAVERLLQDPEQAGRLAHAARTLVEERYDWRSALTPLASLYSPSAGG